MSKFNTLRLPVEVVRKAATAAAFDAERSMEKAKHTLRRAKGTEVVKTHRTVREKQDLAKSLSHHLKEAA